MVALAIEYYNFETKGFSLILCYKFKRRGRFEMVFADFQNVVIIQILFFPKILILAVSKVRFHISLEYIIMNDYNIVFDLI